MQHAGRDVSGVRLVPYQESWPRAFERLAADIRAVLEREVIAIHHIGSTAIPTVLSAKPILDVLVTVRSIGAIDYSAARMALHGFEARGESGIPGRRYFVRPEREERPKAHVHIYQVGHPEIARHLEFRDYLREHPLDARVYSELKRVLADQHQADRERYQAGKAQYIAQIEAHIREDRRHEAEEHKYTASDRFAGAAAFAAASFLAIAPPIIVAAPRTGVALHSISAVLLMPVAIALARKLREVAPARVLIATGLGLASLVLAAAETFAGGWPGWLEAAHNTLAALWWLGIGTPLRRVRARLGWLTLALGVAAVLNASAGGVETLPNWAVGLFGSAQLLLQFVWTAAVGVSLWRSRSPAAAPR